MSLIDVDDTIVAIASPTAPAVRGVVRMSGEDAVAVLQRMGVDSGHDGKTRRTTAAVDLGAPIGVVPVDVLVWPTKKSYTGQPSAELHTYGSLPILRRFVESAIEAGCRAARPGEFTMRSFLAGRLDLTQAEAVLGVIEAEKRGSLDHALRQLGGNLSRPLEQMRGTLLDLLADVEAGLDFVDEDISFISDEDLIDRLQEIGSQLETTSEVMQSRGGGSARFVIALCGEPNAGKSCLINRLAGKEVAIVAEMAGTTRDVVTVDVEFDGVPVTLVDTAGIEDADTEVSRQSQSQSSRTSNEARLRLWCVDASRDDFDRATDELRQWASAGRRSPAIDLWVATKSDLASRALEETKWILCSAVNGSGIGHLRSRIQAILCQQDAEEVGSVVGTASRCAQSLQLAREAIDRAISLTQHQEGHEFVSAELRVVAQSLGEVTGAVYTDDILDRVFGRFCIGK
ncbi:MAG: tRNA modification GTPase [Rubripirellula sp.]